MAERPAAPAPPGADARADAAVREAGVLALVGAGAVVLGPEEPGALRRATWDRFDVMLWAAGRGASADELAGALSESLGARALHGDVPQSAREATLKGFREGKFDVLVATDVAARGLDINGVELVVQCEPPKDPETYIHRSGRTGRAGAKGTSQLAPPTRYE